MAKSKQLRLSAQDQEDLTVLSAALQDAIVKVGNIRFDQTGRNFTLLVSRYAHEQANKSDADAHKRRIGSALRIDGVLSVRSRGIRRSDPQASAVLLAINFIRGQMVPGGTLNLVFAGGGDIEIDVECIDISLLDLNDGHKAKSAPLHDLN